MVQLQKYMIKSFSQELEAHLRRDLRNAYFRSAFKITGKYFLDEVVNSLVYCRMKDLGFGTGLLSFLSVK